MADPEVTFLLPVASQPRYQRRIRMVANAGVRVRVAAVERDYIQGEELEFPVHSLGRADHGHYARRVLAVPGVLRRLRALDRSAIAYAFEAELGLYAHIIGVGHRLIVEVGDIREVLTRRGLASAAIRQIDAFVMKQADRIVATTPAFLTEYYQKRIGLDVTHGMVIENKIDRASLSLLAREDVPPVLADPSMIRIGWFGLLRCRDTWKALKAWAGRDPTHRRVLVRGFLADEGPSLAELRAAPGVVFAGEYRWPTELADIYGDVDLVCAAAPTHGGEGNWLWPKANRFYEAGFFRRPMITLKGSADAVEVVARNIGTAVDFFDVAQAVEQLERVSREAIREWATSYETIPEDRFVETDDGDELAAEIRRLASSTAERVPPNPRNKLSILRASDVHESRHSR